MKLAPRSVIPWLAALALASLTAWLFYPGLASFDSVYQYRQVVGELAVRNYHPPVTVYLWRAGHALFGAGALLLIQQTLYWAGIGLIVAALCDRLGPRLLWLLLIGLLPPLWVHSATLWNDSGVTAAWLFGLGCTLWLARSGRHWLLVTALAALTYGMLAKEHAVLAALPLFACLGDAWRSRDRPGAAPAATGALATGSWMLAAWLAALLLGQALSQLGVERMTKWTTVAVWDLAAVSVTEDRLLLPRSALNRPDEPEAQALQRLRSAFRPEVNGTLVNAADLFPRGGNEAELWAAWVALPLEHPAGYFGHRTRVLLGLLGLGPVPINLPYQGTTQPNDQGLALVNEDGRALHTARAWLRLAAATPLFSPWPYLLLLLASAAYAGWRQRAETFAGRLPLWLCASGLLYIAPLWLLAPATDFRYALWSVACGAVAACAAICTGGRR